MRTCRRRRGISIIEVAFAILILSGVILSMARFGQQFLRADGKARWFNLASELATSRLEMLRSVAVYDSLVTFAGTETSATVTALPSMAHAPGFTRVTAVTRDSSGVRDNIRITVTVTTPQLGAPVAKTAVITRP